MPVRAILLYLHLCNRGSEHQQAVPNTTAGSTILTSSLNTLLFRCILGRHEAPPADSSRVSRTNLWRLQRQEDAQATSTTPARLTQFCADAYQMSLPS